MRTEPGILSYDVQVSFAYDAEVLPGDSEDAWELLDAETGVIYDYLRDIPGIDLETVQINLVPVSEQDFED